MKDLVGHRLAKNPRWAPGVVAVAASFSAFLLIAIARHAANSPSPDDSDDNRSGSRMHNATSTPDSEPDDDHDARDDDVDNGDAAAETLGEGEGEGRNREENDDEEEYVVLTDAEIGRAVERACSSLDFLDCSKEVQGHAGHVRPFERHLRDEGPKGCPCVSQGPYWDGLQGDFGGVIDRAIQEPASSAGLEGNLRQPTIGQTPFANGMLTGVSHQLLAGSH